MKTKHIAVSLLLVLLLVNNKQLAAQGNDTLAQIYSRYDFIPGEKVIFFDDFSSENIGDFPAGWNTNGSGEIVTFGKYPGRWLKITNGRGATCLAEPLTLPDNYTIEFDLIPQRDPANNGNTACKFLIISTPKSRDLKYGLALPGGTGTWFNFAYTNSYGTYYADKSPNLGGTIPQFRLQADTKYRISIWVQKERIRLYLNEEKLFDVAKAMSNNFKYNMIRFQEGVPMISNVRIATGLPDMRNKLLTEGKLVSYGIYFDVNSDKLKPQSAGTLKTIADIITENPALRVKIIGHTDADGDDAANLDLSRRRAASVKNALVSSFNTDAARIETDGMGEKQPVAPNDNGTNKALNRRVEFIKL